MSNRLGNVATLVLQVFEDYNSIRNRCSLADFFNETTGHAMFEADLDDAMKMLESIRIRADWFENKYVFRPLALTRVNRVPTYFEIIDYSEDCDVSWFKGSIVIGESCFEGKINISPIMQSVSLELIER